MKNIIEFNKIMCSNAKKSATTPAPSVYFKSFFSNNTKQSKKSFLPIISIVLSSLLFSFSGELKADEIQGDATCNLDGSTACASLSTTTDFSKYLQFAPSSSGIGYDLNYTQTPRKMAFPNVTLNANNTIINSKLTGNGLYGQSLYNQYMKTTFNLKNSLWNGNLVVTSDYYPDHGYIGGDFVFTVNFDGNYTDTTNPDNPLNGIAFKGNLVSPYSDGHLILNFKNGARWDGGLATVRTNGHFDFNFDNGSVLNGIMKAPYGVMNATFTRKSSMTGSIVDSTGQIWNWTFDDSSIDATSGEIRSQNHSTLNLNLKNNSSAKGKLSVSGANLNVNAFSGSKVNLTSLEGPTGGYSGRFNFTLDNATLQGATDNTPFSYTHTQDLFTIKATNNSRVIGNVTDGNNMNGLGVDVNFNFTNSSFIGNYIVSPYDRLTTNRHSSTLNFSGNNSTDGYAWKGDLNIQHYSANINLSNGAIWQGSANIKNDGTTNLTLDTGSSLDTINATGGTTTFKASGNSSVTTINRQGGTSNYTFDNSSLKTYNVTGGSGSITLNNNSTLDTFNVGVNFPTGIALNSGSTLKNVKFSKVGGGATITADNGHIGQVITYNDNGATNATLTLSNNSSIGTATTDGSIPTSIALRATYGNITATLDNSSVYGGIDWETGLMNATFKNNSSLIGNLGASQNIRGNITGSNNITFIDSLMKGNIQVAETQKPGQHTTLNTSFSGNSSFEGSIKSTGTATLNASFDGTKLNIKDISLSSLKADSTLSFKNISGAKIGNINFTNGTLSGDFSNSSLGNITNTNTNSSLTLSNSAGQTYGNIGSSTATYNGSLKADFDFTPTDASITTIGDIYLGANAKANLSFSFSGLDSNTNELIGKQSITDGTNARNVKITGGNGSSSYAFSNIGTLNLTANDSSTPPNILDLVANKTGISLENVKGALRFSKTNIVLNDSAPSSATTANANSVFSLASSTSKVGINTGTSTFNALNATFGNATLTLDDTNASPTIVANDPNDANNLSSFYTLSQNKPTGSVDSDLQESSLDGKTSNGDIGYVGDNVEKHISFVFTEGIFDKAHSGYTGTIAGGTANSTYSFYNSGLLNVSQITNYLGSLNLYNTYLIGVLGKSIEKSGTDGSITSTPKDVSIALDYSSNDSNPYGLAIVGVGKHNITLNFTGNHSDVKFAGSLLGGTTTKIAGSNNTDNAITIYGLEGLGVKQTDNNSLLNQLQNAGLVGFNAKDSITNADGTTSSFTDENSPSYIAGYKNVKDGDKNSIALGTTFKFLNTTFNSNVIEKDYALDLTFSSEEIAQDSNIKNANNDSSSLIANPNKLIPLTSASFKGGKIDLTGNIYDNKLSFLGEGSISNASNLLEISLGTGTSTLRAIDTGATVVLKNSDKVSKSSSLTLSNTSLIGDWSLGGSFVFGKSDSLNSKFYGKLSNTTSSTLDITLNNNSLFNADDSLVQDNYEGILKTKTDTGEVGFGIPSISFANTDNSKNKLILNNPGGTLKIEGLSKTVMLSNDSSLISNNTSIIGDIYTPNAKTPNAKAVTPVFANLSFNTTAKDGSGNFYQGDNIGVFKDGSSLSFVGKASIRSSKYNSTDKTDNGWVNIALPGNSGSLNLTLNNTGANVSLNQDGVNVGWFIRGNYNIRGTSIKVAQMDSDFTNISSNMVFAKASEVTQQDLLKTSDGSLITSSKYMNGNAKDINDYIEASSLSTSGRIQLRGGTHNYTFIGDSSFSTTANQTILANSSSVIGVNLINLGSALNANLKIGSSNLTDILFASATGGGNAQSTYNYTLRGTSLGDALVSSGTASDAKDKQSVKVNFNAIFDNRELGDRKDNNGNAQTSLQYYTNSSAIGNTNLEIAKSALNGKLVLGNTTSLQNLITANLSFYGNDSFTSKASISGGSSASSFSFNDMNLNFGQDKNSQVLNVNGKITLSNVAASGFLSSIGSGTISTADLKVANGSKASTDNVLAFSNFNAQASSKTDVSNLGGIDYSSIKQGGSFKGTLATSNAMTYTFIGRGAQGFNSVPTIDEATSSISNKNDLTTLDSTLANATINVVDGGKLQTKNLEGTTKGNNNSLNLYGDTTLSMDEKNTISIDSAGLSINATIDNSNVSLWNGGVDGDGNASVNFNISNSATDTDGSKSAIYNFTFNSNYSSPDYDHQFYKGSISGLSADSSFTFNNAGFLKDAQINDTLAKIILNNTVIKGDISADKISLDFRPQVGHAQGIEALSGNIIKSDSTNTHSKDISFDFTGNTLSEKISNDSATDKNYYIAGDKGSKFSFINLENNTSKGDVPQTDTSLTWQASTQDSTTKTTNDAIFNTLAQSGVHLRAAKSTSSIQADGEKLLEGDSAKISGKKVPQNLDPDSTFNFYGSNIHSLDDGSISSSYSLGFIFDSRENEQERVKITQGTTPNDYSSTLNQSSYYGKSISSDKDLSIALYGKNAFQNDSNTLTLKAGNGRVMNITAISTEGSMGNIVIDNSSSTPFASGSSLNLSNVGFKGAYLTSRDNTDSKNPKGGDINANFDDANKLGDGSILGTKDGNLAVSINYADPLSNQDGSDEKTSTTPKSPSTSSFVIGNGKSTLTFANAGVINIYSSGKSFADTITDSTTQTSFNSTSGSSFGANSSLSSNGTSIIGDLYGGVQGSDAKGNATLSTNLKLDLSFDSTTANPTFYQGGSTDTIQGMQFGSSLSFVGKGSLRSSKYDSTTGTDSGSVNINFLGDKLFNLNAINTGGTLNLTRVNNWASASPTQDITWNVKGTSINMLASIDGTINSVMNWNLSFASSGDTSLLSTADGSLLTSSVDKDGNAKDINDYIENSTLAATWSKYRNGTLNITLIGDKALKSSNANMTPNTAKANVNINLINMGNAFVGSTNASDGTTVANNTNLNNLLTTQAPDPGSSGAKENILILGTNIEDASTNTNAGVNVSLGAIFDNRDLKDRLDSNGNAITSLQYYSNSIAMGNTNLEIAKSALLGTFTLDPNLSANIAFYGKDAISSSGKIVGGNSKSNVIVSLGVQKDASDNLSYGSFDFASTKGFKGNVYVLNTTLSSPLEDKSGVTLSDGSNVGGTGLNSLPSGSAQNKDGSAFANTDPDASLLNTFTITFNDNKEGLKAGLDAYNENHKDQIDTDNTDNTDNTGGNTDSTPPSDASNYLSSDASTFITKNIIGTLKDANGNALDLDLNNIHSIDKAIGYTTAALNVNFIGANSIKGAYNKSCTDASDPSSCTYTPNMDKDKNILGFYIHDDNANNVYNFIDFGKIDVLTFAQNGVFNGQINWVGHSYQIGLIKNGLGDKADGPMVIDFDNLPDKEVANNIYQATNGIQNILFDFGGSPTTSTDTYKMNGAILQGDKTQDSSYTFSNLGKIDISSVDATLSSGADFYDVLSKTINGDNYGKTSSVTNKDLSALQLTKGTIGIANTSITGDITWNKKPAKTSTAENPSYDRDITLKANFDDSYVLDGSLKGDGNKDITFNGESSFKKDTTIIEGTDASSNYTFNNAGLITQSTLNNLLNAGSDEAMQGKASNAGNFDFEGGSVILANITDAKDTQNISNQTINLGQKSDKGVMIRGEISTSAKVNAKFGVGSIVDILNKNDKSSYDFSSLATSNAPIIASINLNTNDTQNTDPSATDGIKKATIIGLDKGNVSLIGSINDSDITSADGTNKDATVTTNNIYQFGNASATDNDGAVASWLITADSKVKQLNAFNTDNNALSAALASSTFSNAGSVIDLRGARMLAKTQNNSDLTISGSMRADSGDNNTGAFNSVTLEVENANLNKALFRLGVDTNTNTADQIIISQVASNADGSSTASTSSNALQVYLDQGSLNVDKPILLAQASTSQGKLSSNYFFGAGYSQGLYFINPKIAAVDNATINPPSDTPTTPDTGATPDDTSKPADTTGTTPDTPADATSTTTPDATNTTTSNAPATPNTGADTSTATPNTGADTTGASTTAKADTTSTTALAGALATSGIKAADTDNTNTDTTPKDTSNADLGKSMSWYLTGFNASADTSITSTLSSTLGTFYRDFRIATNNLNLRMGELRNNSATQGVWARVINGMGSDTQNNKDFYTTLQAGYDYQFDVLGGVNYLGVDAEASMVSSKGDAYTSSGRNLGLGIYNTYIMDNGFYVDASAKYLNLGNRISIANSTLLGGSTSNLTSNAFLLGAEVGYRYSLDTLMKLMKAPSNIYTKGYYIEPQLEMIYGYITGNNYDVSVNNAPINVALSGSNALISRLGAVLGKHFKYDNGMLLDIRVGLSYINELNTGGKTTLTQESGIGSTLAPISLNTAANNKLNLSLGANVKLSDDWRLYADVSRTFLGTYNFDYNLNVGARFSFGKKMSDLEKQIKADKNKKQEDKVDASNKKTEAKEKSKLLEEKKTVKLDTKGAKVGCQGCLPEAGLYLQVAVLAQKDSSALKEISKHSYRAYEFELTSKDKKKQKVTRYLIGPFKNIQEVYENKKLADRIVQDIDGDKKAYAIMYEVK